MSVHLLNYLQAVQWDGLLSGNVFHRPKAVALVTIYDASANLPSTSAIKYSTSDVRLKQYFILIEVFNVVNGFTECCNEFICLSLLLFLYKFLCCNCLKLIASTGL